MKLRLPKSITNKLKGILCHIMPPILLPARWHLSREIHRLLRSSLQGLIQREAAAIGHDISAACVEGFASVRGHVDVSRLDYLARFGNTTAWYLAQQTA